MHGRLGGKPNSVVNPKRWLFGRSLSLLGWSHRGLEWICRAHRCLFFKKYYMYYFIVVVPPNTQYKKLTA